MRRLEPDYSFSSVMGGETGIGGKEVVVVMTKKLGADSPAEQKYKLLATCPNLDDAEGVAAGR